MAKQKENEPKAEQDQPQVRTYQVRMDGPLAVGVIQVAATSPEQAKEILTGWFAKSLTVTGG